MAGSRTIVATAEGSAALRTLEFKVLNTDGSPKNDLAAAVAKLSINGATGVSTTNNFAFVEDGWYKVELTSAEVTLTAGTAIRVGPISAAGYQVFPAFATIGPVGTYTAPLDVATIQAGLATSAALATLQTAVNTIDDLLDTEIAALIAAVGVVDDLLDTEMPALTTAVATLQTAVTAVKAKTDSLNFTVAGSIDANTLRMNGTTVLGNGTAGNKWRG